MQDPSQMASIGQYSILEVDISWRKIVQYNNTTVGIHEPKYTYKYVFAIIKEKEKGHSCLRWNKKNRGDTD